MSDQVQAVLIIITLLLAGYAAYRVHMAGLPITLASGVEMIKESRPVALEVMEIVQIAVNSAEQLKREEEIKTNDEAFNHALNLAKQWIPDEWEVSNEDIIESINAAVLVASALAKQAGVSSEKKE